MRTCARNTKRGTHYLQAPHMGSVSYTAWQRKMSACAEYFIRVGKNMPYRNFQPLLVGTVGLHKESAYR